MSRISHQSRLGEVGPESIGSLSELDMALRDPLTEAKFNGLKRLNAKKVAKLMAMIDLNQNELTDMKIEGKDNVRTRIIQGLKKKISYHDTVLEFLKVQMVQASEQAEVPINAAEIEEVVMRKTIGGPKRFRPVGRVEIEKKISDLEKKIKGVKIAKEAIKEKIVVKPREVFNKGPDSDEKAAKIRRIKMSEENSEYQRATEVNDKKIQFLTDLLQNMRNRSSQPSQSRRPGGAMITEDEFIKMKAHNDDVSAQLERQFTELAVTEEELIQSKADSLMASEHLQLEYDRIVSLTQKSARQNEGILRRMAELESELDRVISGSAGSNLTTKAFTTKAINADNAAGRCQKLKDDIKGCQSEIKVLEEGIEVANNLKDSIRLKNEEIRELKRAMQELARLEGGSGIEEKN